MHPTRNTKWYLEREGEKKAGTYSHGQKRCDGYCNHFNTASVSSFLAITVLHNQTAFLPTQCQVKITILLRSLHVYSFSFLFTEYMNVPAYVFYMYCANTLRDVLVVLS